MLKDDWAGLRSIYDHSFHANSFDGKMLFRYLPNIKCLPGGLLPFLPIVGILSGHESITTVSAATAQATPRWMSCGEAIALLPLLQERSAALCVLDCD